MSLKYTQWDSNQQPLDSESYSPPATLVGICWHTIFNSYLYSQVFYIDISTTPGQRFVLYCSSSNSQKTFAPVKKQKYADLMVHDQTSFLILPRIKLISDSIWVRTSFNMANDSMWVRTSFNMSNDSIWVRTSFNMSNDSIWVYTSFNMSNDSIWVYTSFNMSNDSICVHTSFNLTCQTIRYECVLALI